VTRGELTAELAAALGHRHEARFIVEDVLGPSTPGRSQIVGPADLATARDLAARRLAGEPLQYVLGHWAFRTLDLLVDSRVLIPRPETECVVGFALSELARLPQSAPIVVDIGTGSGAIALALAVELSSCHEGGRIWATDTSAEALTVAAENLERVRRQHDCAMLPVAFGHGPWLNPLPPTLEGAVGMIVSNPPYVARDEWPDLSGEVRCEPFGALVAGDGSDGTPGLADVERVLVEARTWLARPGVVVIELAPHQAPAAVTLARDMGYADVRIEDDLAQRPRALIAWAR
jgi:release factor glutamine methyltransferase